MNFWKRKRQQEEAKASEFVRSVAGLDISVESGSVWVRVKHAVHGTLGLCFSPKQSLALRDTLNELFPKEVEGE